MGEKVAWELPKLSVYTTRTKSTPSATALELTSISRERVVSDRERREAEVGGAVTEAE